MQEKDSRSFSVVVTELQALTEEVASLTRSSESEIEIFNEFTITLEKFTPIFDGMKDNNKVMDIPSIRKAIESLERELRRAKSLIRNSNSRLIMKQMEGLTRDIGRSLGLVLFASIDLKLDIKGQIGALHKELMNAKFDKSLSPSPSQSPNKNPSCESGFASPSANPSYESGFASDLDSEKETEIEEETVRLGIDDVVLQLKYGDDEGLRVAILNLNEMVTAKTVDREWINEEDIVSILLNRLGTSKPNNRLSIFQALRTLASEFADCKGKMVDVGSLSALVKSLTRDVEERREAVGLLLDLSDLPAVWRRLGRIQGCIIMLVAMLLGDDPVASYDAGNLLDALSSNTQNALHMAEAGYFKPLVKHLQEGSDMCKILMATALSKMELTDQSRASLAKDGAIEPLVKMFKVGKLEAKLSALSALKNLSILEENIPLLISSGIVALLLQLLFSVTSVLMTLREPASAILARVAQSESILVNQDVAQQMLSLLNLSSPTIQYHLLQALNSIAAHSSASNIRRKMQENGAIQLLLPFLKETSTKIRIAALNLICTLSKDMSGELTDQLGECHVNMIVNIVSSSTTESEKAAAVAILSNLPVNDKKATELLKKVGLLPILISIMNSSTATSTPTTQWLAESVAGVLVRFTVSSDKKLQQYSVEQGVIPLLVKLLSSGSVIARSRAASSLAQLSQNSLSLRKSKTSSWLCVPPSADAFCEVHDGYCFVKSTFCLVKAGAIPPLVQVLEGRGREADEAVLAALATLMQDEICESGSNYIAKSSGIQAIVKVLESGTVKAQEKALWILERIFTIQEHRVNYGESAQVVLIDLAQNGDSRLKSTIAKILAQLELLQGQSSYF
ncbi:U-box domain-containing protein 44-like [Mangifera indica]|uniref:U-box domain-containing protein 44-like n=1 Tax=Mangifera indica TaxID=29780 RepID=UPI001CFB95CD|nr:U-box domain-containing protein 44-like [Mangifera indica]XP_044494059.1 U-box domain-containing protein 44-like [Mangifera indica]